MTRSLLIIIVLIFLLVVESCLNKNREIRHLNSEISALKEERSDIWLKSCKRAVDQTCFYGDCGGWPIEVMQDTICKVPEEL